ncbi:MAG: hypothetical protein IKY23_12385 [Lachnospiraceae bacterium]|nr:hypothetical protein [Lachnospiraceae bacterium]
MSIFSKKEKMDLLQKTQYNLEQAQKNLETVAALVPLKEKEVSIIEENTVNKINDKIEPMMAAYALNLCTVSVTQIVDYMDLNIMEQEYEMILNNLNLQNMPNDEALLDILKQILNTITFFKIDQKERAYVEKEYQLKMKNAVWSAVPNIGALVASGLSEGPAMTAFSLAASVGTAYMSYRRQKAENTLSYEKELWQLEKSAIEQFDGLKRELFDTAWRLSKHFGFDEKMRLTERLIHQYNEILMDTDNDRRYARMEAISKCFGAYPPFWYQFGHTANLVVLDVHNKIMEKRLEIEQIEKERLYETNSSNESIMFERLIYLRGEIEDLQKNEEKFRREAKQYFEKFQELNRFGLLREDKIASMCNLEYVDLLLQMEENNKEKLRKLIEEAAEKAGNSFEIIQLCVFAYMKLGEKEPAEKYLLMLVNEDYNKILNAQILSSLYVYKILVNQDGAVYRRNYSVLCKRVPSKYLFPLPKDKNVSEDILENQFIYIQKFSLLQKYELVLNELTRKYAAKFNKCIPVYSEMKVDEFSFYDIYENRITMKEQLENRISRDKSNWFINQLAEDDIFVEYMKILQEYFLSICRLVELKRDDLSKINCQYLKEDILKPLVQNANEIEEFRRYMHNAECDKHKILDLLFSKYTFLFFAQEMLEYLSEVITERVQSICNMNGIAVEEAELFRFCIENGLKIPTEEYEGDEHSQIESDYDFLVEVLLGDGEYERIKSRNADRREVLKKIEEYCIKNTLIKRDNKSRLYIRGKNDLELERYFMKIKRFNYQKSDVLAVIEEKGLSQLFNYTDLWFTTDGLVVVKSDRYNGHVTRYVDVKMEENEIKCGKEKYSNGEDVDIEVLCGLIVELQSVTQETSRNNNIINAGFANNVFEAVGGLENPELIMCDKCLFLKEKDSWV